MVNAAEHDLSALQILLKEAHTKPKVCAHVCHLAHQVAEKSLKAGMYYLNGLNSTNLRSHKLHKNAKTIEEQVGDAFGQLEGSAYTLRDYYTKTRYPNTYKPDDEVPSDHYYVCDAIKAEKAATNIIKTIRRIVHY